VIDENVFFREVTLRLCGHLEVEEALRACFDYLTRFMPGDAIYYTRYEPGLGAIRVIVRADAGKGERLDRVVPLSEAAKTAMEEYTGLIRAGSFPATPIFDDSRDEPVTHCVLRAIDQPDSSVMCLPLVIEGKPAGILAMVAGGDERFEEQHARLFSTVREPFFVAMSNILEHEVVVKLKNRLADDNRYLNRELLRLSGDEIIGADLGLREVMRQIRQVAPTDSPVLLTGETGVGKDVIANAIHLGSSRCDGPFVPVNCGAIPDALLDSELFGHEKGAFTGALSRKRGRFERADRGTILLDEIGEMPLDAQVRLLRVLQHREVERVGGTERIPVDIRIIAATNRDLREMVKSGRFREDLWFRLNVFPIDVPPLRKRCGDIPALVPHFIERKARELKIGETPKLAPGAMETLMAYDWPGNVRELENLLERSMILHRDEPIRFDDLIAPSQLGPGGPAGEAGEEALDLDAVIAAHIRRVLELTGGKIHGPGGAGERLGVNPNTLRHRMRKLGIPFRRRQSSD